MKKMVFWTLMFSLSVVVSGRAQTVTGSGTVGTIPIFTGSSKIGNSLIIQFNGNIGIGTATPDATLFVDNPSNSLTSSGLQPYGVYGRVYSSINFSGGVRGDSRGGGGIGTIGVNFQDDGMDGGGGVEGLTLATTGFSFGVRGEAAASSGNTIGVFGINSSPNGVAGLFVSRAGGDILLGRTGPAGSATSVFRVDSNGTVFADGGFRPNGADFAEAVQVKGSSEQYAPGDLLVIDASGARRLSLSQTPYSTLVAGIYSTQPGVVASQHRVEEGLPKDEVPLAVVGIVPCKVTTENGSIVPGDLLVTSSTPGHAMKGTDRGRMLGAVVGKALEPLQNGTGVIQVLVTLQ